MQKSPSQSFDRGVTIAFLMAVILIAVWTLANAAWWGSLFDGDRTWQIELPRQPVWSDPHPPSYAEFRRTFNGLPPDPPKGATIGIEVDWYFMLNTFVLYLLGVAVLFAGITLLGPASPHNIGIYVIRSLALSLAGAAAACFVVWLVVGGWGPPYPTFFGLAGIVIGIVMGVIASWRRTSISR